MKEGDSFIAYTPAFDLVAHGDSFKDANDSFVKSLKLFMEYVTQKGTWKDVLEEYGWKKAHKVWNPPIILRQDSCPVSIPIAV
ncbi:MAG: hypothetical protein HYS08_06380 [Chlamydiae bacterium]|nr:hypothetical protein [Chlamydiota bacterium]MBI3267005.1 hypothetical protein [Chlamydiota bacterium]